MCVVVSCAYICIFICIMYMCDSWVLIASRFVIFLSCFFRSRCLFSYIGTFLIRCYFLFSSSCCIDSSRSYMYVGLSLWSCSFASLSHSLCSLWLRNRIDIHVYDACWIYITHNLMVYIVRCNECLLFHLVVFIILFFFLRFLSRQHRQSLFYVDVLPRYAFLLIENYNSFSPFSLSLFK